MRAAQVLNAVVGHRDTNKQLARPTCGGQYGCVRYFFWIWCMEALDLIEGNQ